jgi:hypothetical protein
VELGAAISSGIHGSADFEQQAALLQQFAHGSQDLIGQLVFLQPVAKPKNGALIGRLAKGVELGEFAVQRGIEEGLLHGWVRQAEPLLHEVHLQHRLQSKGRATGTPLAVVRGDQLHQGSPRNHGVHLLQEHLLAGPARAQAQIKAAFFHGDSACRAALTPVMLLGRFCRISLRGEFR